MSSEQLHSGVSYQMLKTTSGATEGATSRKESAKRAVVDEPPSAAPAQTGPGSTKGMLTQVCRNFKTKEGYDMI
eukprot:3555193-Amphidinium_carterae.1